jgi:phosphoglycolate phosphatase
MTVLVLFDIDGTMLLANGAGRRAVQQTMHEVFAVQAAPHHPFDGKTDPQIVRELAALAGVDDAVTDVKMDEALGRYYEHLDADITASPDGVVLLPGVLPLLDALESRDDVLLGLLTGNIEAGATRKLRAVNIAPERFVVGAFGSDAAVRPALPAIAQARAQALVGRHVPGEHVVIIGDTPHDLTCGTAIGARAIGVETVRFRAADLLPFNPLAVFSDLRDTAHVVATITGVIATRAN